MSDLDAGQKAPLRLWVFGAVGALLLHVGGAGLALSYLQTDEPQNSIGDNGIEVGYEQAAVKKPERPQDKPTETEEEDREVTPNESKKPKEDDPKVAAVQTQASTESV